MTVSTRLSAPNYKIFEPDALDAIYAKGTLDPLQGGIAYALGNAHKVESSMNADRALESQDRFNRMAANLDAMEIGQKHKEAAMKIAGVLAEHGEDPTKLQGMNDIYTNPADSLLPGLLRGKIQSEIARNQAGAAADRGAGADTVKVTEVDSGTGRTVETTSKAKPGPGGVNTAAERQGVAVGGTKRDTATDQRAKAAVGADAVIIKQEGGITAYGSPSTRKIAVFDATGKMIRQQ